MDSDSNHNELSISMYDCCIAKLYGFLSRKLYSFERKLFGTWFRKLLKMVCRIQNAICYDLTTLSLFISISILNKNILRFSVDPDVHHDESSKNILPALM